MNTWNQFSVYDPDPAKSLGEFTKGAFGFLSLFYYSCKDSMRRWHYLFEPQILIRFQSYNPNEILDLATIIANQQGLVVSVGDIKESSPSGQNGWHYYGEQKFYGSSELWEANADFLHAMSKIAIMSQGTSSKLLARKHAHLLANQFGMHYGQEAKFWDFCARRARALFKKFGKQ